jgi:signal peptidase
VATSTATTTIAADRGPRRLGLSIRSLAASIALVLAVAGLAVCVIGPATGSWRLLPILSGSMAPSFPPGSLVLATPTPAADIRRGEVIVFHAPLGTHHLVAHRVVRVIRAGADPILETKGDANRTADPWNLRLRGTTAWVVRVGVPLLGYGAVYAKQALALLLLTLGVGAAAVILVRRIWRDPARTLDRSHDPHAIPTR